MEDKDLHACHCMKRRGMVILKFKDRKLRYQVMANRKNLMEKKNELKELYFEESLYLRDSICTENHICFTNAVSQKVPKESMLAGFSTKL